MTSLEVIRCLEEFKQGKTEFVSQTELCIRKFLTILKT